MGLSILPFHNSATAVAKFPRVPFVLLWVGISKALLIKEQQFLYLGNEEIDKRTVASDITGFLWHLRQFPNMTELYGGLFCQLNWQYPLPASGRRRAGRDH